MMLTDMADVLRSAGLDVLELPGWRARGEPLQFDPLGIMLHHDGMGLGYDTDPTNDLNVPEHMAPNGNLGSQLWVQNTGRWVIMAAGRKSHAGYGVGWRAIPADQGNRYTLGVETDHTDGNPWPVPQVDSIDAGCRALARHYGYRAENCCGHREYAPGRKHDPESFDLDRWRAVLAGHPQPLPEETDNMTPDQLAAALDAALAPLLDKLDKLDRLQLSIDNLRTFANEIPDRTRNAIEAAK